MKMSTSLPTIKFDKPGLPTLWLDTSVVIKLAKIEKREALQEVEVQRTTRLRELVHGLVRDGKLLCPESDQEEEYVAERLDGDVHRTFALLSLGVSMAHRQGIFDEHIFRGMEAYAKKLDTIFLPSSTYFHGDPIRRLEEARKERFIITVGPFKNSQMLKMRADSKAEVGIKLEELRQKLVTEGQTYEKQLKLEQRGYWDGMVEILKRLDEDMQAGRPRFWNFTAALGPFLYRRYWSKLQAHPPEWKGVSEFFTSAYYNVLPLPSITNRLNASLVTGNEPIASGDPMDVELLSVALPMAHYVLTDKRMELRIKKLGLDAMCGTDVFSMSSIDGLFAELEKLK